jgi:putative flippase GtrA
MSLDDVEIAGVPAPPEPAASGKASLVPGGQFLRYLCVGVFNTTFGYFTYAIAFTLLSAFVPAGFLYLAAPLAAIISTPLNITVAYLGYKFFVFRTKGNYVKEWIKCFAVYGTGMIPGLLVLSALTRLLQTVLHSHGEQLLPLLAALESHLSGRPLAALQHIGHASALAGYLAGAITMGFTTIFGFIGHKKVTFARKPA